MPDYAFDWVDAFTDTAFSGNGCAVVHGADDLTVAQRMALVAETSLTECAFLVRSDKADFGARYYLRHREIAMAGHPTVATVASLMARGEVGPGDGFTLEVGAGVLPIAISHDGWIEMVQPAPAFGPVHEAGEIAAIVGLGAEAIAAPPRIVSTGSAFCVTLLRDRAALEAAILDPAQLAEWNARHGHEPETEPYLVCLDGAGGTLARLLLPPPQPAEDAFTGSATGCAGAYLWAGGHLDRPDYEARQGQLIGREGVARVRVEGPCDRITGVAVAGQGRVLMSGLLHL
ncbi:PhzF family phenazine biosynthesis protein [Roseobacter sp. HKCCA0434]|uniref:PhzF family phenazine biosynthesis protein n=1 Tax=Roseobacter sp. HKCCA0434 TaxID=3079297 RepID=UPI002905BB99|nr:PhzF family phenazine biosynthesis protein [Roseobacter sp. HKCCA0434]